MASLHHISTTVALAADTVLTIESFPFAAPEGARHAYFRVAAPRVRRYGIRVLRRYRAEFESPFVAAALASRDVDGAVLRDELRQLHVVVGSHVPRLLSVVEVARLADAAALDVAEDALGSPSPSPEALFLVGSTVVIVAVHAGTARSGLSRAGRRMLAADGAAAGTA